MPASVKPIRNFGTKSSLDVLRVQLMAGEMATNAGARIRARRIELGMKRQRDLVHAIEKVAEAEGEPVAIDNQRVSDWERGVNQPSERYWVLIAKALKREVAWFYEKDKGSTPDLSVIQGGESSRLERIEAKLDQLLAYFELDQAAGEPVTLPDQVAQLVRETAAAPGRSAPRTRS